MSHLFAFPMPSEHLPENGNFKHGGSLQRTSPHIQPMWVCHVFGLPYVDTKRNTSSLGGFFQQRHGGHTSSRLLARFEAYRFNRRDQLERFVDFRVAGGSRGVGLPLLARACVPQLARCPFTVSFLGEGSPTKIDYRKKLVPLF